MIIIQKHLEVYRNTTETNQLWLNACYAESFPNNTTLFKFIQKITGTGAYGTTKIEILFKIGIRF